jgi:hypothetical protein
MMMGIYEFFVILFKAFFVFIAGMREEEGKIISADTRVEKLNLSYEWGMSLC